MIFFSRVKRLGQLVEWCEINNKRKKEWEKHAETPNENP